MSKRINPKLKVGDRIVLIHTSDDSIPFGTKGVVNGINKFSTWGQYDIKWDNGSSLFLLDDDKWMYEEDFKSRKSSVKESMDDITRHSKTIKYFKMGILRKFLEKLRESGVTNMYAAGPYLWMGKERILNKHRYEDTNEEFDELLEMADEAQSLMINGCIKKLQDNGKEVSTESINRCLQRSSSDVLNFWMDHYA